MLRVSETLNKGDQNVLIGENEEADYGRMDDFAEEADGDCIIEANDQVSDL